MTLAKKSDKKFTYNDYLTWHDIEVSLAENFELEAEGRKIKDSDVLREVIFN